MQRPRGVINWYPRVGLYFYFKTVATKDNTTSFGMVELTELLVEWCANDRVVQRYIGPLRVNLTTEASPKLVVAYYTGIRIPGCLQLI